MNGWSYMPDPRRWPAKIAAYLSIARDLLREPGALLNYHELVGRLLQEEGIEGSWQEAWAALGDERLRVPEVGFLAMETLSRMVADGEATVAADGMVAPPYYAEMAEALGWTGPRSQSPRVTQDLRSAVRLLELEATPWEPLQTWPGVDALVREGRQA
jgi:hypothetical protein